MSSTTCFPLKTTRPNALKKPELFLNKGGDRRLVAGHRWIYSNEVDAQRSPLGAFSAGDVVELRSAGGRSLGAAFMEPQSLICARCFSVDAAIEPDTSFFISRLQQALALRQRFFPDPCYRLAYGDSDGLPGVVVDRFGDYLVLQLNNAAIERYSAALVEALVETIKPRGILLRPDSRMRREQGLAREAELVHGEVPQRVELVENGVRFLAPVYSGQKTGWFYDHRNNRAWLRDRVAGARVLDVYSYVGAWGVQAAVFGAAEVCCVDSSGPALDAVIGNAELNAVGAKLSCRQGPADQVMQDLARNGEQFDVVILDPPAFVQKRRDLAKGRKAYRRINELAMKLLRSGGLLVSGSCSMHLSEADLIDCLQGATQRSSGSLQIVGLGHQGEDHPVHPAIAETRYLKAVFGVFNPAG